MGSRRGKGGKDQIKIVGLVPGWEGDRNGETVTFGVQEAVNGPRDGLEKAVTCYNVREALGPVFAEGAAEHIRKRVAETSASRPGEVQGSDAES